MKKSELIYNLPPERIASRPLDKRSDSKMLLLPRDAAKAADMRDESFAHFADYLREGDLLVVNDTKVIPARLLAQKDSGGEVEFLLTDPVDEKTYWALAKGVRKLREGMQVNIGPQRIEVQKIAEGGLVQIGFDDDALSIAEQYGHVPLPPYIQRPDDQADRERYQTLFAREPGAVAAPTAALHFDQAMLQKLDDKGVRRATLTLHVGPGTFQPVRVEDLDQHVMGEERYNIDNKLVEAICQTRSEGGRVIAVGTTTTRALESAATGDGKVAAERGRTRLFIKPGYQFQVIDGLLTNFHLPGSTLIALVMALAGRERVLQAYQHAVASDYRFYSYGDCMLII